jgi:hypothetical protein
MPRIEHDSAFPPRRGAWGGRRPGAGGRPGNFNALKHGRDSKQLEQIVRYLARDPAFRTALELFRKASAETIKKSRAQS